VIDAVQRLLREREPAKPRKAPKPAAPGWSVVPFDNSGDVWLHLPPDNPVTDDEKEPQ
jgi:hypothetical protein